MEKDKHKEGDKWKSVKGKTYKVIHVCGHSCGTTHLMLDSNLNSTFFDYGELVYGTIKELNKKGVYKIL